VPPIPALRAERAASEEPGLWDNVHMRKTSLPQPHEQREVEQLLKKLSKAKPISAKPAPISYGISAIQAGITEHRLVYYST
jgi:hypothetical protein